MSLSLLFLLSAVLAVKSQTSPSPIPSQEPDAVCTVPGFMCKNCNQVSACILNPLGFMTQLDVQSCAGSCRDGACVNGEICNWRPFECAIGQTGTFPDPYDCTKFHVCNGITSIPDTKTCPKSIITGLPTAYGPKTGSCGYAVNGNENCIGGPVPRCQKNLQVDVVPADHSTYYICTQSGNSLGPMMYKCATPMTSFNVSSFVCS